MSTTEHYCYIAEKDCGCCIGAVIDEASNLTAEAVGSWVKSGLKVRRISLEEFKAGKGWGCNCSALAAAGEMGSR